jgi:hypothetical protein
VQLDEFPTSEKQASKQVTSKIQVREINNRRAETGDTRMYSCSSFLLREVHLCWRGVVTQSPPMPQRLTLFSAEQATEASSFPLSSGIGAPTKTLTRSLGHESTTQLEAPKNAIEAETPQRQE